MQRVNCEEIHSGRLQTNAAYKASAVNYGANVDKELRPKY